MTINKEAKEMLTQAYRLHDRDIWPLREVDYSEKLRACRMIARHARTLLRNAEKRCNGIMRYDVKARMMLASWTEQDESRAEKSDAKAESFIRQAAAILWDDGIVDIEFQRDPRGAMVKFWNKGERDISSPRMVA